MYSSSDSTPDCLVHSIVYSIMALLSIDLTGLHVADDDRRDAFGDNDDVAEEIPVAASEIVVISFLALASSDKQ